MTLLPIVRREMNVLSRRAGTYRSRTLVALLGVFVLGYLLLLSAAQFTLGALGKSIFVTVSVIAFVYALFVGVYATSDCISEEKRERTLGLLFLTDLKSYDIILGKMAASSFNAVFALLAILPIISLGLLAGGIALAQIVEVSIVIANTMFLSLAVGSAVSCLSTNERRAMLASSVLLFLLTFGPFVLAISRSQFAPPLSMDGIWLSPLYPFLYVHSVVGTPGSWAGPYAAIGMHHALAWTCLCLSMRILPRFTNELPSPRFARFRELMHRATFGSKESRERHRAQLLDRNAFLWLAGREREKPKYGWIIVSIFTGLYFWLWVQFPAFFFDMVISLAIVLLLNGSLKLWFASEVCNRLIEDRRSGALELLLSSPLSVPEITHGQALALRRIFFWPILFVTTAELLLGWGASRSGLEQPPAGARALTYVALAAMLVLDCWALKWVGLWLSLTGKTIERVLIATVTRILVWPWLVAAGMMTLYSIFLSFVGVQPRYLVYLVCWSLVSIALSVLFGCLSRAKFLRNVREVAAQPFSRSTEIETSPAPTRTRQRALSLFNLYHARGWLLSAALAGGLLCAGAKARQWYWNRQVEVRLIKIHNDGLPAGPAEIGQYYPPLPAINNPFQQLNDAGFIARVGPGLAAWNAMGTDPEWRFGTIERVAFEQMIQYNRSKLEVARSLAQAKSVYVDPLESTGARFDVRGYDALLGMDLVLSADSHSVESAEKDIAGLIGLARAFGTEPSFAQSACAGALMSLGRALEFVFLSGVLSDEALARIYNELSTIENIGVLKQTLVINRALLLDPRNRPNYTPGVAGSPLRMFNQFSGSESKQLAAAYDFADQSLAAAVLPETERLAWAASVKAEYGPWLQSMSPEDWDKIHHYAVAAAFEARAAISARTRVLKTAVAVHRYVLQHNSFPSDLQMLIPTFLAEIQVDPFTGAPIVAKHRGDSHYVVYSVGPDRVDGGGVRENFLYGDISFVF